MYMFCVLIGFPPYRLGSADVTDKTARNRPILKRVVGDLPLGKPFLNPSNMVFRPKRDYFLEKTLNSKIARTSPLIQQG